MKTLQKARQKDLNKLCLISYYSKRLREELVSRSVDDAYRYGSKQPRSPSKVKTRYNKGKLTYSNFLKLYHICLQKFSPYFAIQIDLEVSIDMITSCKQISEEVKRIVRLSLILSGIQKWNLL